MLDSQQTSTCTISSLNKPHRDNKVAQYSESTQTPQHPKTPLNHRQTQRQQITPTQPAHSSPSQLVMNIQPTHLHQQSSRSHHSHARYQYPSQSHSQSQPVLRLDRPYSQTNYRNTKPPNQHYPSNGGQYHGTHRNHFPVTSQSSSHTSRTTPTSNSSIGTLSSYNTPSPEYLTVHMEMEMEQSVMERRKASQRKAPKPGDLSARMDEIYYRTLHPPSSTPNVTESSNNSAITSSTPPVPANNLRIKRSKPLLKSSVVTCQLCNKTFKSVGNLNRHRRVAHEGHRVHCSIPNCDQVC